MKSQRNHRWKGSQQESSLKRIIASKRCERRRINRNARASQAQYSNTLNQILKDARKTRHFHQVIRLLFSDRQHELHANSKSHDHIKNLIWLKKELEKNRSSPPIPLIDMLLHLENVGCKFYRAKSSTGFMYALKNIIERSKDWIRPIFGWKPISQNPHKQLHHLIRYLFTKFDVPEFLNTAWMNNDKRYQREQNWLLHIGNGRNIRTAPDLPLPLTKRLAHYFLQSPSEYTIDGAFRWAQIRSMGGSRSFTKSVMACYIAEEFKYADFWLSVYRWLIANPSFPVKEYQSLFEFLYAEKFYRSIPDEDWTINKYYPRQPNLSMSGRTTESLLKQIKLSRERINREDCGLANRTWKGTSFLDCPEWKFEEDKMIYSIQELLKEKDLMEEGKAMQHCVASYATSCFQRYSSIWSLRRQDCLTGRRKRLVTIEVNPQKKTIVQIKGRSNRAPELAELTIIKKWSQQAKIDFGVNYSA